MHDTLKTLYEYFRKRTRQEFSDTLDWQIDEIGSLEELLDFIWKKDWPDAKKFYTLGAVLYLMGVGDTIAGLHPCVKDVMQAIKELDDQGIDVEGIRADFIIRTENHRPEQMAKWKVIAP